ncbi:MAG TPA: haloacid dehalogenase-like hydrolase [Terriglobales bacterium]|jgi:phosphoserine phosphatase|nr:haloacid dehalogenase-like hydrolase [Terriglobales bacterium]
MTSSFRSAGDFIQSVLDLKPRVAVFDCDGTLWSGDAGEDFFYWEIDRRLLPHATAKSALSRYEEYKRGQVAEEQMCGEMVTIHKGIPEEKLIHAAEDFFAEKVALRIFPQMQELIMDLCERACQIWAVSSTNEWVVHAGARRFGIPEERVLAACVEKENGCASNRLLRVPTGQGKAQAINEKIGAPVDVAFGNTVHDVAMLSLARHAFAIGPDAELEELARLRGWVIYRPET